MDANDRADEIAPGDPSALRASGFLVRNWYKFNREVWIDHTVEHTATSAQEITERLKIPTIGIGAGAHCDGQVLVIHDMLGLFDDFTPKFVKRYADLKRIVSGAAKEFIGEVKERKFPTEEHSFK